jgi:hypothetical protein
MAETATTGCAPTARTRQRRQGGGRREGEAGPGAGTRRRDRRGLLRELTAPADHLGKSGSLDTAEGKQRARSLAFDVRDLADEIAMRGVRVKDAAEEATR